MITRALRAGLVAATATGLLGAVSTAHAQDTYRIGATYIMSGPFSTYGEFARNGAQLAVDEINDAGGVMGHQVEILFEDSQGKADVAIQAIRKLVYQEEVDALMGLDSSGVARGVTPVVPELKRPFLITHAATPDVTGNLCNRYVFRDSVNIPQNLKSAALVAQDVGAKTWTTIGPDYAFGHQSWEYFQKYMKEMQPEVEFLDGSFPEFGSEDMTPHINSVIDAAPDGVLISLWGGQLVNFVRQAKNLGFFDQEFEVLLTLGAATEVLTALGDQMPEGLWVGTRYWFLAKDHQRNTDFVKAFHDRYGKYPSYNAQNAYTGVYVYKAAIEKAGSTDPEKVTDALAGLTVEAPIGKFTIRAEDHQAVVDGFWGVTSASADYPIRILDPIKVFPGVDITPPPSETGCSM